MGADFVHEGRHAGLMPREFGHVAIDYDLHFTDKEQEPP